jgi:hypothetical protein
LLIGREVDELDETPFTGVVGSLAEVVLPVERVLTERYDEVVERLVERGSFGDEGAVGEEDDEGAVFVSDLSLRGKTLGEEGSSTSRRWVRASVNDA